MGSRMASKPFSMDRQTDRQTGRQGVWGMHLSDLAVLKWRLKD